jgi:hypothetical protein
MKKISVFIFVLLATVSVASAQFTKIGGGLGFTSGYYFHGMKFDYNKSGNFNIYAKAVYEFNLPFHVVPSVTFFFPHVTNSGNANFSDKVRVTTFVADINAHYVFNSLDRFEFYGLVGPEILLAWKKEVQTEGGTAPITYTYKEKDNALGLNVGLGTYVKIAQQMDLNIEAKYVFGHYHQFMFNAGVLINMQYIIKHSKEPI